MMNPAACCKRLAKAIVNAPNTMNVAVARSISMSRDQASATRLLPALSSFYFSYLTWARWPGGWDYSIG
jgi:hypothetical protein